MQVKMTVYRLLGEPWNSVEPSQSFIESFAELSDAARRCLDIAQADDVVQISVFGTDGGRLLLDLHKSKKHKGKF